MTTKAAEIRAGLSHPIIDADGHFVEVAPLINEEMLTYLEEMGGPEVRDRYALDTGLTDTSTVLPSCRILAVSRRSTARPLHTSLRMVSTSSLWPAGESRLACRPIAASGE